MERVCIGLGGCSDTLTEYANCSSDVQIEVKQDESCNRDILTLIKESNGVPVTSIDLDSLKSERFNVAFIQNKVQYCEHCYDGVISGFETGIDCGGDCRACKFEGWKIPALLISGILLFITLVLLIPLSSMARSDANLVEGIRKLIKSGETALGEEDRNTAENNFRRIKWLYVQIESAAKKKLILKEMQRYHKKIKAFSEF